MVSMRKQFFMLMFHENHKNNMINYCPLCNSNSTIFYKHKNLLYHQCNNCFGIFVDKNLILDKDAEMLRYKEHNNNVEDKRYQEFVSPITSAVLNQFSKTDKGLDFGAGTGPVISKILNDNNFNIVQYDPFFHNFPKLLEKQYNYIVCCEVMEHFNNPKKEFTLLKKLLLPNGKLFCMTDIYNETIDFHNWRYKNDQTHIFIYHKKTIQFIKKQFGFSKVTIDGKLISFFK